MATAAPIIYRETHLSIAPPSPISTLTIDADPSSATALIPFGAGRKRGHGEVEGYDEESFKRRHIAKEGSIYFRPKSRAPRSFVWRVLNNQHQLELQCVDLIEEKKHRGSDCWLTFQLNFPSPILPNGVALSDGADKDVLDIFVLSGKDIYTVTLPRALLVRETTPSDFDPSTVVKKFSPSNFAFRTPYRIIAVTSLELFISLQDGGLMRLQRQANESPSQWRETFFSEGGWSGTLKGIAKWRRQYVQFGDEQVDTTASVAIAKSPKGPYVWTVTLNHQLKAWNTETGKITATMDLVDQSPPEERKGKPQYTMAAEQGTLIQVLEGNEGDNSYVLVVHSPKDHQFKFYAITHGVDDEDIDVRDLQHSETQLIPPISDLMGIAANIWHLEQFHIALGPKWQTNQLWLRARSGQLCKSFTIEFDLLDSKKQVVDLSDIWKTCWTAADSSSLTIDAIRGQPDFLELDPIVDTISTPSEKWLKFLFYPGRFSEASLETALHTYRKLRNLSSISSKAIGVEKEPLKERLVNAVASKILLRRLANELPDYDHYQLDLQAQWQSYFSLLSGLHAERHASIGFALDFEQNLPWTICADYVAPIRLCSDFEMVQSNAELALSGQAGSESIHPSVRERIWMTEDDTNKSYMLAVARQFRHYLSPASQEKLRSAAVLEALDQSVEKSATVGLQSLYDRCGFGEGITDEDFAAVNDSAEAFGGLGSLTDDLFLMVLEAVEEALLRGTDHGKALQRYGKELAITVAQETLQQTQSVLLDLLALVVFMHGDLEQDELSNDFRPAEIYDAIILRLRHTELRLWLVGHVRQEPKKVGSKSEELITMTLYESMFIGDWKAREHKDQSMPELLTAWSKEWTFGVDLNTLWAEIPDYVAANLIKTKETDLALEVVKFMTDSPWSSYLKGRISLATGDYASAALFFRGAAQEMGHVPTPATSLTHAGLLSEDDVNYFGQGIDRFYQHVLSLFEALKVYSYTADFAQLALASQQSEQELGRDMMELDARKSKTDSPVPQRIDDAMEEIRLLRIREARDNILGRLFNALVQTGRFEQGYSTLVQVSNPVLQNSNLATLISRCIREDCIPVLLSLPISGDLTAEADAELFKLAKRSMGTSNKEISGPPYHQILFAFRTQNGDFRGAAALLYMHLQHLLATQRHRIQDPDDDTLVQVYVLLINTLACCDEEEAWLLADPIPDVHPVGTKRKLVTLAQIRKDYAEALDRRSDVQMGRFAMVENDDVDMF